MPDKSSISTFMSHSLEVLKKRDPRVFEYDIDLTDVVEISECPMCDEKELQHIADVSLIDGPVFFRTSVCVSCHFTFRSVFPGFPWFKERWKQISTSSGEVFNPDLEEQRRVRYQKYCEILSPYIKEGARVLDIGGGYGTGAVEFRKAGCEVEILEPEDDRVHYARSRLGLVAHHAVLEEFTPEGPFDVILWSHNLEHVDHPRALFAKVASWLKPKTGLMYLEVPLVWNIIDWSDALFMAHKSNFAESHIAALMRKNSLNPVYCWYPKMNSPVHEDIGVIATFNKEQKGIVFNDDTCDASVEEIRKLYLKMAPFDVTAINSRVLHYEVPCINQFYTTIRYDQGKFSVDAEKNRIRFDSTG